MNPRIQEVLCVGESPDKGPKDQPMTLHDQYRIMTMTAQQAVSIPTDAYIYRYPLVTSKKITGLAFTNMVKPDQETFQASINQLVHQPEYPSATYQAMFPSNRTPETK